MNPTILPEVNPALASFWLFCANQLARIHRDLYPEATNPRHVRGPRRPDMAEQERNLLKMRA